MVCVNIQVYLCIHIYVWRKRACTREQEQDFKESAYMIVEADKSTIYEVGLRIREELMLQLKSRGRLQTEFLLPLRMSIFFPLKALD